MSNGHVQPSSMGGIKRLATQIKKRDQIPHHLALDVAAQAARYDNFRHAQNALMASHRLQTKTAKFELYLTVYWQDRDNPDYGRETLRVETEQPISKICSKWRLKYARGFSHFRQVTDDHFVCDDMAHSQEWARGLICKTVRVLRFMEASGLRPSRNAGGEYPQKKYSNKIPRGDHGTIWDDPTTGQVVLIDEPYLDPVVDEERQGWAKQHNWHVCASKWPGMCYPYCCSLFVVTDASTGIDIDGLMRKIDNLPAPLVVGNWNGESVKSHDIFLSPLAVTAQDKRRSKAHCTIVRVASKTTVPFRSDSPVKNRKPKANMPLSKHRKVGRMIKAILESSENPGTVTTRMWSLRSRLEDWLGVEYDDNQLSN